MAPELGLSLTPLLVVAIDQERWHRPRPTVVVDRDEDEVGAVRVAHRAGDRIVGLNANAAFHRCRADVVHRREQHHYIADMHWLEERHLVDRDRDGKPARVPDGRESGRRVDEPHDHAAVHRAGDVHVGDFHHLGEGHGGIGDAFGREIAVGCVGVGHAWHRTPSCGARRTAGTPPGIIELDAEACAGSIGHVRRNVFPAALVLVLASCGGTAAQDPSHLAPTPGNSVPATPIEPSSIEPAAPSPSVATLPEGVPATFDEDVPARDLPVDRLIPPGDEVTGVDRARTSEGEAVVIAFTTPGPDPFVRAGGLVVWRRSQDADPPWRAVYGLAHSRRDGVLAISADATDLTGDGSDDALIREETGGSGACATYRVIDLAEGAALWKRSLCDAEVQPSPDPLGLFVIARVYEPGDPHCCPSAISERVLAWRDDRFLEISEVVTPF